MTLLTGCLNPFKEKEFLEDIRTTLQHAFITTHEQFDEDDDVSKFLKREFQLEMKLTEIKRTGNETLHSN